MPHYRRHSRRIVLAALLPIAIECAAVAAGVVLPLFFAAPACLSLALQVVPSMLVGAPFCCLSILLSLQLACGRWLLNSLSTALLFPLLLLVRDAAQLPASSTFLAALLLLMWSRRICLDQLQPQAQPFVTQFQECKVDT